MKDVMQQRENQLLTQKLEFEKILGEVGCAVWKTNLSDGALLSYSRAAEEILKVNLRDHLGQNFFSLPGFDASRQSLSDLHDGLLKGQTVDKRVLFETPDGEAIWLKIRAKPVQQKTVEGILLDVTTEHVMEERQHCFQDAFEQTEDAIFITDANISASGPQLIYANAAKSNFMAVMSHELRTPLNPIIGMGEILAEEIENEEHQEMLKMIDTSARNLLRLIDDILDFTQVEVRELRIESRPFFLNELVRQCIGTLRQSFEQKNLSLEGRLE